MDTLPNPFLPQKGTKPARQTRIVIGSEPWRDRQSRLADFDPFSGLKSWLGRSEGIRPSIFENQDLRR